MKMDSEVDIAYIDILPSDIVVYELLPKMDLGSVYGLSLSSRRYAAYAKLELDKRIAAGNLDFSNHSFDKLFKIGKDPRFKYSVIQEVLQRIKTNKYGDYKRLYIFPEHRDRTGLLGLNSYGRRNGGWDLRHIIEPMRSLLDSNVELGIDGIVNSLDMDGAAGFLLGLYLTNQLQNHNIKLGNISLTPDDSVLLFFPFREYGRFEYFDPNGHTYGFNSLYFLSNLKLAGLTTSKIWDKDNREWIPVTY